MTSALNRAAALMAARLQINRAYRAALDECGETEATLPLDEVFGPKDREALAAYESAIQEILGMQPLPFPVEKAS